MCVLIYEHALFDSIQEPKLPRSKAPRLSLQTDFTWDDSIKLPLAPKTKDIDSESDSEDEGQPSTGVKKRKLSKAEQRLEEQKLFEASVACLVCAQCDYITEAAINTEVYFIFNFT